MALPSLDQLSDRECELLRLLSQGHTVKTAVVITGDSENAANELLRSARRKLSVNSSREAARLLADSESATQENRYRKTGIAKKVGRGLNRMQLTIGGIMFAALISIPAALVLTSQIVSVKTDALVPGRPNVISTFPVNGSTIPPGPFELKVTFDRPMAWQVSILSPGSLTREHLGCIGKDSVKHSADRRSFTLQCEAIANADYIVAFGDHHNGYFVDDGWTPAIPYVLSFSVADTGSETGG